MTNSNRTLTASAFGVGFDSHHTELLNNILIQVNIL